MRYVTISVGYYIYRFIIDDNEKSTFQELGKCHQAKEYVNVKNGAGYTPLFLAIRKRKAGCVEALLACGAGAEEGCQGRTPLEEALSSSDPEALLCLQALVKHSPDLATRIDPSTGETCLHKVTKKEVRYV